MGTNTEECCKNQQYTKLQCHDYHQPQGIIEELVALGGFEISGTKVRGRGVAHNVYLGTKKWRCEFPA